MVVCGNMVSEEKYNKLYSAYLDLLQCNDDLLKENIKVANKYKLSDVQLANNGVNDNGYYEIEKEKLKYNKHITIIQLTLIIIIFIVTIIALSIIEISYLKGH